jgi:glutamate dehydrogenase/leucine dehydrogenase
LCLSRGIAYKSALEDLPFGGGKSVIIVGEKTHK